MSFSPSLAVRAVLALALMIGFYALALGISVVLLYLPYAEIKYGRRLDLRLAIFCLVGAAVILWSILPRRDRFVPPGPRLEPGELPRLFQELTRTAQAVGQSMPAEVYLVPEVNAWVAQRGGIMGFGSRRVMGLGLPLLQILTVAQLRAVLAHEFGHYHGGDTKLGPWVYKTRAAIERTLQGLAKQRTVLLYPFLWYGKLFLRVTLAISRRQEFSADELASRVVGSRPLIEGLKAIHGGAIAYAPYWAGEATPVLDAGFLPPLAEGFGRFVAAVSIAQAVAQSIDRELAEAKADPYDSHPPLRDRMVAVKNLPPGDPAIPDLLAVSLLENTGDLERRLLSTLADEAKVRALKPVEWENVGMNVYLPNWENFVRENPSALEGITPAALPEISKNLAEVGGKMRNPAGELPSAEKRVQRAAGLLGAALALALNRQRWVLHAMPGELYFQHGELKIEPFAIVPPLASGELKAETWREQCAAAGIADLKLADVALAGETQ